MPRQFTDFMMTKEVAALFHVSPKTVARWASEKKLPYMLTLGGHRRYPRQAIMEVYETLIGNAESA